MNTTHRNVNTKVQKHVKGEIQQLMDIMETIHDRNIEQTSLVQRIVRETLACPHVYEIMKALVEKAVAMII